MVGAATPPPAPATPTLDEPERQAARRRLLRTLLVFAAVHFLLFAVYRVTFLLRNAPGVAAGDAARVLLYGSRLDLALLGIESALLGFVALGAGEVRLRATTGLCLLWTGFNVAYLLADLAFYHARNQHMAGLVLDNLRDGHVVWTEIRWYVHANPLPVLGSLLGGFVLLRAGLLLVRRQPALVWDLRGSPRRTLQVVAGTALGLLMLVEPVPVQPDQSIVAGYSADAVTARHYARLDDFTLHEAIVNPLQEMLCSDLPQVLVPVPPPRLDPAEAEALCLEVLGRTPTDPRHPLLTEVVSDLDLGIDSVCIIQVESLTGSLVEHVEEGRPLMPFLASLAARSLYYPRSIQGFGTTAGGVFCTTTGLPRTALGEPRGTFTARELAGRFSSLPRILGPGRDAWFFGGFRQSTDDYRAFATTQGFRARTYAEIKADLEARGSTECCESALALFDGVLLDACLRAMRESGKPFVAHVMTGTTHAPWILPPDASRVVKDERLRAFQYFDQQLERFVRALESDEALARRTLLVVVADHTNPSLKPGEMERLRIPILFTHPRLAEAGLVGRRDQRATHADILPTTLALMGGRHPYAGVGRNLLAPGIPDVVLSSTLSEALYFRGPWLLRWRPHEGRAALVEVIDDEIGMHDRSSQQPEIRRRLERECLALYETVFRLSRERRIWPAQP